MKTFGILPLFFAMVLCFGTTSCQSIRDGLSQSGKSGTKAPTGTNYKKLPRYSGSSSGSSSASGATEAGRKRGQGALSPMEPVTGGITKLVETEAGIYRISTGDEIIVDLLGIPEADRYEFILAADGNISLPLVGTVLAKGRTAEELKNNIIGLYVPDYYRSISVNVIIPSKPYYIQGEVNDPGTKRMEGRTSFTQAIAAAAGVNDYAHDQIVYVKRGGEQFEVNREEINENPELDFEIFAGDVITVKQSRW